MLSKDLPDSQPELQLDSVEQGLIEQDSNFAAEMHRDPQAQKKFTMTK